MRLLILFLSLCFCIFLILPVHESPARETRPGVDRPALVPIASPAPRITEEDAPPGVVFATTAVDTYCIVHYDFGQMDWQGWTRVDNTAQVDTFFHVDDFDGLGGGAHGRLVALEGAHSLWCGARPDAIDPYLCSWDYPPGYGNSWEQMMVSDSIFCDGALVISYRIMVDVELDYDSVSLEYLDGSAEWQVVREFTGIVEGSFSDTVLAAPAATRVRFRVSTDVGYSDEDGVLDTDGAAVIDSIRISDDGGPIDYEDFEGAAAGAKECDGDGNGLYWRADIGEPYGLYSGLAWNLYDLDPCNENAATQIVFFTGSTFPSAMYPGLFNTPFCLSGGGRGEPCQDEMVVSPVIDMFRFSSGCDEIQDADIPPGPLSDLGGALLRFTIYEDLPKTNLVFWFWHVRSVDPVSGCPGEWRNDNLVYYSKGDPGYTRRELDIGTMVGDDPIQVALGVVDLCWLWYPVEGNCISHTPAPWFDNVSVVRYGTPGPQWSYNEWNLFQDNFPGEEWDLESYVRADRAEDISATPAIVPGDYIEVTCASPTGGGIDTTGDGRPRVYMYVRCRNIGPDAKPDLVGPVLAGDYCSWSTIPAVPPWTPLQADRAWPLDTYRFDLNDSLFTRGYMIDYYFRAYDQLGRTTVLPPGADTGTPNPAGVHPYFEFTCLPTLSSDILYVDDYDGVGIRGGTAQYYHDDSYQAVLDPMDLPDRYDVNAPKQNVSNGLASRAKLQHLIQAYETIIWDSGDLAEGTITDGLRIDKTDDCTLLNDWIDYSDHDVDLWICGDNIASDLAAFPSAQSMALMFTHCGVNVRACSFYQLSGGFGGDGNATPLVYGIPATSPFFGDNFYAYGGCPDVNHFDVLDTLSTGMPALCYEPFDEGTYYAAVQNEFLNGFGEHVQTMWFGFSLMFIRDCVLAQPQARNTVMKQVFDWFGTLTQADVTGADRAPVDWSLSRNYPNPFNPSTTIDFSLRERGLVRIDIYDVSGRLVRTIVNEVRDAGRYTERWDGRTGRGAAAASGIYFCRMESGDWTASRKLVLLR